MPKPPLPAAVLILALAACYDTPSGGPPAEPPLSPVVLTKLADGDGQAAIGGTVLPRHLQVRVTRDGAPVAGIPITWGTGNGSVSPEGSFTSSHGIASTRWTLGDDDGEVRATASIYDAPDQQVEFRATSWPRVEVRRVTGSATGEVGTVLDPLTRVQVTRHGKPAVGIPVTWEAIFGTALPVQSVTDQDGIASTTWTLGSTAGTQRLNARVRGHLPGVLPFEVVAHPGPPTSIALVGTYTPRPANFRYTTDPITVAVTDRFGNPVDFDFVHWQVVSGPGIIELTAPPTTQFGQAAAHLRPLGTPGTVVVRVVAEDGVTLLPQEFAFSFTEPVYEVHLTDYQFRSPMNGSQPAMDTIPVGATLRWRLTPFDYDIHAVESVGTPSFTGGGEFPYGNPSVVTATFTTPGTYQYRDPHYGATGTVVVQ